jgi:hypothetical protein
MPRRGVETSSNRVSGPWAVPSCPIFSPFTWNLFWEHLPEEKRRKLVADLIVEIETEAALRCQRTGSQVLGASAVRGQHPFDRPKKSKKSKKSPAPLFHAASKAVRRELYEMYGWFVAAFWEASEKLRGGNRMAKFPAGSFPPALPFVAV